jgi:hypothetical protein
MKSVKMLFLRSFLFLLFSLMVCSAITQPASPPLDPDPPGSLVHPPNGSPIDGGLVIFLSLGCICAGKEIYKLNKKKL